ncbi:hypothetical protein N9F67_00900 [bacterium]|nr:hypothetical protein [bacterium]
MAEWKKVVVSGSAADLASLTLDTALPVGSGGTGASTLTNGGVLLGSGTGAVTPLARLTAGQIVIGSTTGDPVNASITGGSGIAVTSGSGTITIAADGLGAGTVTNIATAGSVNGLTLTGGPITTTGTITLGGTLANIANSALTNDSVTIGSTEVTLGSTVTTFAGLTSVTSTAFVGALTGNASTATKIASITNSNIVQLTATQTLTNKTLTSPTITGTGAIAGVFTGDLTGDVTGDLTGNADTATTATTANGVAANSVTLGTDTTGNYVATLGTGTGVTIGSNTGETSSPTIAVNYGSSANTAVEGDTTITLSQTSGEIDITGTAAQALGGAPSYTIGLADTISGNRTFSGDTITINNDLIVQGTASFQSTTNLEVADQFILLNSGSSTDNSPGGIVVQQNTQDVGVVLGYDAAAGSNAGRWGTKDGQNASATTFTADAYVSYVIDIGAGQTDLALYQKNGNIKVDSGDIFIYA